MKAWVITLIGSAVFLFGAAATNGGQGGPPGADSALVGGGVNCFDTGGQAQLSLNIGGSTIAGGGVVGIPATSGGPEGFSVRGSRPGTCADALAALALPAPLCATGPAPGGFQAFGFACSGGARDVIEAVGDLAKAMIALP